MSGIKRPTGQRVLVENVKAGDNVRGIYIAERHQERHPAEAVVVAVGEHVKIDAGGRPLALGDRVLTARYEGIKVRERGRMMRLLAPQDILAIVTTDND